METDLPIANVLIDDTIIVIPIKPDMEESVSYEICSVSWCIIVIIIFYVLIIFPKGFTN